MDVINGGGGTNTFNVSSANDIAVPTGALVTNIQTVNLVSTKTVSGNYSGFTGLTALNVGSSTGGGAITAPATAAVVDTNTLATHATAPVATTIDGGATIGLTATGATSGALVLTGDILIGGTTAPTGAVTVTATETVGVASSSAGNITVKGGTDVTVHSTVNTAFSTASAAALTGTAATAVTAGHAAVIVVNGATGVVNVTSATNTTSAASSATVTGAPIYVTGGTTVTVNETASVAAADSTTETINQGAVTVTGGATTTAVTVTQAAAATGAAAVTTATAGLTGVSAVTKVTGSQGATAVAAVALVLQTDAIPVAAATPTVTDGAVVIVDKYATLTTANTISSVTLANYGASSTISSTALSTLTLSGAGGTLGITEGGSAATIAAHKTLTLNLAGSPKVAFGILTDSSAQFSTVNAVLTSSTTLGGITDGALRTLAISGTGVLTLSAVNTALTSITETGAAGFNDSGNLYAATGVTSFSGAGSTGANTVTLNANQAFAGGSGVDTVTINADPNFAITGGGGANVLVLGTATTAYTLAGAGTLVSGFPTMSSALTTGTFDMAKLPADITALISTGNASTLYYTNVVAGTTLTLNDAHTATSYKLGTLGDASTAATLTLNNTPTTADFANFGTVTLQDVNGGGIAIVNLASNGKNITTGQSAVNHNTIVLTDAGITALNVSGTVGLDMGTYSDSVAGLTIGNTNTGTYGLNIRTVLNDTSLSNLTFTGSGNTHIAGINDGTIAYLTLANSGTGVVEVDQIWTTDGSTDTVSLTHLTLNGNIATGPIGGNPTWHVNGDNNGVEMAPLQIATTGAPVVVSGATDNAGVDLLFTGGNTSTTTVTLGNGNNYVYAVDTAGGGSITTGSGTDYIRGGTASATNAYTLNGGAGDDAIWGGLATASHPNILIGGDGADYLQGKYVATWNGTDLANGLYNDTIFTGSQTTGVAATSGSWTGTLYAEGTDVITTTGENAYFKLMMSGSTMAAGFAPIFNGANIVEGSFGNDTIVASTAKDVFLFQTSIDNSDYGTHISGKTIEHFQIGTDWIATNNYVGGGDHVFVGSAAAATAFTTVIPGSSQALLASGNGWSWGLDAGKLDAGTLTYTGGIGGTNAGYATFTVHLVGVQGTIAGVDSFFYHA